MFDCAGVADLFGGCEVSASFGEPPVGGHVSAGCFAHPWLFGEDDVDGRVAVVAHCVMSPDRARPGGAEGSTTGPNWCGCASSVCVVDDQFRHLIQVVKQCWLIDVKLVDAFKIADSLSEV